MFVNAFENIPNETVVIIIFLNINCHAISISERYQTIRKIKIQ
jgi:hypothetical protein